MKSFIFRFGDVEVREREYCLVRAGDTLQVEPRAFRVLLYLLRNPGRLVTKDEILTAVWNDCAVTDNSLTRSVATLRRLLEDDPREPHYIATVQTMGYRFLGDVKKLEDRFTEEKADPPHDLTGSISPVIGLDESATIDNGDKSSSGNRMRRNSKLVIASIAATIVIAVSGGYLIRGMVHTRTEAASSHPVGMNSHLRIVPLTSLPGAAGDPSLSPDGQQVAFFWNGEAPAKWNLYVQLVGGEKPLQLTHFNDGFLCCADWSPDGREIIFGRCDDTGGAVFMIPALGGAERKLTTVVCSYARSGHSRWTADGKSLVLTDSCTPGGRPGIVLFSLATGEKKCLHAPPAGGVGDSWPAPSPDGTTIAFTESPNAQMSELHTVEVSGNNLRQLTHDGAGMCQRPMWSPDGKHIAFESSRSGFSRVWRIAASGGPIELDTTYPSVGSLSRDGRRLAYDESGGFSGGPEVWRVQLASAGGKVVSETRVLASGGGNMGTQLSPDERQIAFHSGRSGSYQIWKSDTDGANPLQLTFFNLGAPGTPRWSPDGKWIVFDGQIGTHSQIFLVDSEGRNTHAVTSGSYEHVVPSFSRDGKTVYFASNRTGNWQVWRLELSTEQETQITRDGGFAAFEAYDGRTLYHSKFEGGGIWSVPVGGGAEQHLTDAPHLGDWGNFAVVDSGFYFVDSSTEPGSTIFYYNLKTRRQIPVVKLKLGTLPWTANLASSRDGRTLFYAQSDPKGSIMLAENFQ